MQEKQPVHEYHCDMMLWWVRGGGARNTWQAVGVATLTWNRKFPQILKVGALKNVLRLVVFIGFISSFRTFASSTPPSLRVLTNPLSDSPVTCGMWTEGSASGATAS